MDSASPNMAQGPNTLTDARGATAARRKAVEPQPHLGQLSLDRVGNTPLLRLGRIAREMPSIEILGKAEWFNPGGSVKDRAAANIVG